MRTAWRTSLAMLFDGSACGCCTAGSSRP